MLFYPKVFVLDVCTLSRQLVRPLPRGPLVTVLPPPAPPRSLQRRPAPSRPRRNRVYNPNRRRHIDLE